MALLQKLNKQRIFFESGSTQTFAFRKAQLEKMRTAILHFEEKLNDALMQDLGKNKTEIWVTEIGFVLNELKYMLKNLKSWMQPHRVSTNLANLPSSSFIVPEPLGNVLIIGPWNYPFQLLFTPLVGAIAGGNCVVLKSSEFAPATSKVMQELISKYFEEKYILFVEGDGAKVVPEMMENFTFDHVFYTGSTRVGQLVYEMAAKRLVPVTLELGGKSPCVITADADIKTSAKRIALSKFSNAGQMCVAPDYLLVHNSQKDALTNELQLCIKNFFGEDASKSEDFGRIVNQSQFDRLAKYLDGAKILYGGNTNKESLYIEPTLVEVSAADEPIMQDEIFGPILPIYAFETMGEALQIIRPLKNPLAFYIFTSSNSLAEKWLQAVPSGGACVNNASLHLTNHHLPFGGRGFSGIGQYHGKFSFDAFTHKKALLKTPTWIDPAIKYPPYKGKLGLFKKIIG